MAPLRPAAALPAHPPRVVRAAGAEGRVSIGRDTFGIPHVEASSVTDLFVGQGFATAQDRLWQLEWDRRRALGRSAELVGTAAAAVNDAFCRRARLGDAARAGCAGLDDAHRRVLEAYAAGVNAFLGSTAARPVELQALDVEPEPWEPWHCVAVFLVRHVTFATWQAKLWRARLFAALGPAAVVQWRNEGAGDTPLIVPPGVREAVDRLGAAGLLVAPGREAAAALAPLGLQLNGSNAWALDGAWTASGSPLVAGDPHRPLELPNVYAQVVLRGDGVDAAGLAFPGVPGIPHFGQSRSVAWAVTNAMAEYQDLFVERFDAEGRYLAPGGVWAEADVRHERVQVRDGEPVDVPCVATAHGPVILGGPGHGVGVALASTGLVDPAGSLSCTLGLLGAASVEEVDAAFARWVEPANNVVCADTSGAIAYRTAGSIPLRGEAAAWLPVPGWSGEFDWRGRVPDDELPRVRRPPGGRIVTANQRVVGAGHPHLLGVDAAAANRADRIWACLGDRRHLEVEDQAAVHRDCVSEPLLRVAALVAGLDDAALDERGRMARDLLVGWDGRMLAESVPAGVAAAVRAQLVRLVAAALPEALQANPFAEWEPPATALPVQQRVAQALDGHVQREPPPPAVVAEAVAAALADLVDRFGDTPAAWRWGARHTAQPAHPLRGMGPELDELLDVSSGPLSGDVDCVWATNSAPGVTDRALTGSTARYVWDLGDRRRSRWVVPLGASGHPASPHFRDQQRHWARGELVPVEWEPARPDAVIEPVGP